MISRAAAPLRITRRAMGLGFAALASRSAAAKAGAELALYFLAGSKVMTAGLDGSGLRTLATGRGGGLNDGIAYDPVSRRLYWTNMGRASLDDGFIQSVNLDGSDLRMVAPPGSAFTPKQCKIDAAARKIYWSDREGMRVMRCNLDGSAIEVLVETGTGDADRKDPARWCVGIALDIPRGHLYWTQKGDNGRGTIYRCGLEPPKGQGPPKGRGPPKGQGPKDRRDAELLFSGLPEPIDLDFDPARRLLYWTDRGDNTVSRAPMDPPRGADPARRTDRQILVRGLHEAIGVTLDLPAKRMFYTSLGGEVGSARLDGSDARLMLENLGALTGVTLAPGGA
jgi:sugar lactone lactonase YvrE